MPESRAPRSLQVWSTETPFIGGAHANVTGPAASAERLGRGGKYAAKWRLIKSHNVLSCGSSRVGGYFRGGGKRGYIFHLSISMSVQYYCNGILCSFRGGGGAILNWQGSQSGATKKAQGSELHRKVFLAVRCQHREHINQLEADTQHGHKQSSHCLFILWFQGACWSLQSGSDLDPGDCKRRDAKMENKHHTASW